MSTNISKSQSTNMNQPSLIKSPEINNLGQMPHREFSKANDQINTHKNNFQEIKKNQSQTINFFEQNELNEKFFPPKTNYLVSENNDKIKNNLKSPIIDYFSQTSNNYLQKFHSPEEIIDGNKNSNSTNNNKNSDQIYKMSPTMANNLEQNFDYSPSNIFNNNFLKNTPSSNSLNNILIQNNQSNEEGPTKTLQERIGLLVGKNDTNNFNFNINRKNNVNPLSNMNFLNNNFMMNDLINNNNNTNNNTNNYYNNTNTTQTNEDEDENQEEAYILNFNSDDEKDIEDDIQNNMNNNINYNMQNNIQNNVQNNNIKTEENNLNDNNGTENDKNECLAKKVLIKKEMPKPYIPNRFRNNEQQLNNIINNDENKLPSYGGVMYNNEKDFKKNNNMLLKNNYQNMNTNSPSSQNNNNMNNNINNITTNNVFYPIMNNNFIYSPMNLGFYSYGGYPPIDNFENNLYINNEIHNQNGNGYYPQKIGEFLNLPMRPNNFNNQENNKFTNFNRPNNNNYNKNVNNFYYNGDQYQIYTQYKSSNNNNKNSDSNSKSMNNNSENKNSIQDSNGKEKIYTIGAKDLVTTITSNNKKIKRINPKTYLNESYEYLSHNIFILSKDQAGCRFLQEKLEKEPEIAKNYFYEAILPYILPLVKDPFGNYLIQKLCKNLDDKQIKKILEKMAPTILDIGANSHGTRVIQQIINYLNTKELLDYFLEIIKPHTVPLLKELNGTHIIQKLLEVHPECGNIINKIIVDNCSNLATHRHGCCVLQKFLDSPYEDLKNDLIKSLINNCLVLIIDQFGNYVIQSVLLLKDKKACSEIALKICDNVPYYSKHRYSSNVVEKCFDFCGEEEKKMFVEKLSPPEVLAELILDDHGNYVIQKALYCAEGKTKENMLKSIIPLIPKIKEVSFGERLLNRLFAAYPQLNMNNNSNYFNFNPNNLEEKNLNNNINNEANKRSINGIGVKRGMNTGRGGGKNYGYYNNRNKYNEFDDYQNYQNKEIEKDNVDEHEKIYKNRKNKSDFAGKKNPNK